MRANECVSLRSNAVIQIISNTQQNLYANIDDNPGFLVYIYLKSWKNNRPTGNHELIEHGFLRKKEKDPEFILVYL